MKRVQCLICKIHLTYDDSDTLLEHLNEIHYGMDFLSHVSEIREEINKSLYKQVSIDDGLVSGAACQCLIRDIHNCGCPSESELSFPPVISPPSTSSSLTDISIAADEKKPRPPRSESLSPSFFKSCYCPENKKPSHKTEVKNRPLSECACPDNVKKKEETLELKPSVANINLASWQTMPSRKSPLPGKSSGMEENLLQQKRDESEADKYLKEAASGAADFEAAGFLIPPNAIKMEPQMSTSTESDFDPDPRESRRLPRSIANVIKSPDGKKITLSTSPIKEKNKHCDCCAKKAREKACTTQKDSKPCNC